MMLLSKHAMGIAAAGIFFAFASPAKANSIVLSESPYSYSVAGEFSITASDDFIANYAATATLGGEFQTFCVETIVFVNPGQTYSYTLSGQDSMGRPLTEGAAFLYYEFATGQLAGYNYATPAVRQIDAGKVRPFAMRPMAGASLTSARQADASELQAAIWELQGHQSLPGYPSLDTDPFYELAIDALGTNGANSADNGQYGVEVLQLWDGSITAQNQLVYVGVPDSGSTGGMLALACAGLVFLARRVNHQEPAAFFLTQRILICRSRGRA